MFPLSDLNETAEQRDDALLLSNVVPMFPEFQSECSSPRTQWGRCHTQAVLSVAEIWAYIQKALLKKYASTYQGVNVVVGPVFDYDYNGQHDTLDLDQSQ